MSHILKIPGHSGSKVELLSFEKKNCVLVRKTSNNPRLVNQETKQFIFYSEKRHKNITTPEIVSRCVKTNDNNFQFSMKYSSGLDIISFLSKSSTEDIKSFTNTLTQYLKKNIDNCKNSSVVANEIIYQKTNSVYESLLTNEAIFSNNLMFEKIESIINYLQSKINKETIKLPSGECHGDLTFSNMFVNVHTKKIVFFDFLDTYFESPIQDMIKIKQDLDFGWTLKKIENLKNFDTNRYKTSLSFVAHEFDNFFNKFDFYLDNYETLQILNFLRIIVYSKDYKMIDFLVRCIERIK